MSSTNTRYHTNLSNYFGGQPLFFDSDLQKKPNIRKCMEQPWQQTRAELWDEVTDTLCNLDFIQAKAAAKKTYDLVNDFNELLKVIPDNAENIQKEKARQERMEKYVRDLIACARGEISRFELQVPESITHWTQEKIDAEIERIKINPTRLDKLNDFLNFLGQEAGNLQKYAIDFIDFSVQQAWNYSNDGPVSKESEKQKINITSILLLRKQLTRPAWNPVPQVIHILKGHTNFVTAVSISTDGRQAMSGSHDKSCIHWNLQTGGVIQALFGHFNIVHALAITPDGKFAVTGSYDHNCILWELHSGNAIRILKGHNGPVEAIAITPDGEWVISGSSDNSCIFWNAQSGKIIHILKEHTGRINAVSITPDGKMALSGSSDNSGILWNLDSGLVIHKLYGHKLSINSVSITPDGKLAITGSADDSCILWNVESGKALQTLFGHSDHVYAVSITPDGCRAISGSRDKTCILWDLKRGIALKTLIGHKASVNAISITPDGMRAISGSWDKTCIIWNLETGHSVNIINGHTENLSDLAATPDWRLAITASWDNDCILWDLHTGLPLSKLSCHSAHVLAVSISPDGEKAISGSWDNTSILWDLEKNQVIDTLKGHSWIVTGTGISPDGKRAVSGGGSNCILWDLITGQALQVIAVSFNTLCINPEGRRVIIGTGDKPGKLYSWDMEEMMYPQVFRGHTDCITAISVTPDGKLAFTGSEDKTCLLWNLETGQVLKIFEGHNYKIDSVAITSDGRRAISVSQNDVCNIWDLKSGKRLQTYNGLYNSISILQNGRHAISASKDNTSILWDLETGDKLACFISSANICLSLFSPQGIILGNKYGEVIILDDSINLNNNCYVFVTIRMIWDFDQKKYQALSVDCPFCGFSFFSPPDLVIETIQRIHVESGLTPEQSPCLDLPDEAWEEPGLLGECPNCHGKLKFNPFIAGGDDNHPSWKFWKK